MVLPLREVSRQHKRALLIGVSGQTISRDMEGELHSYNDVKIIRDVLMGIYGYASDDIVVMLDDTATPAHLKPSRANILKQASKLVKGATSGDKLFFFFAGHGVQHECDSGSEDDGSDEFIKTSDGKYIKDNRLRQKLVEQLPAGSQLIALFDSCHGGTMLDLPYRPRGRSWSIAVTFTVVTRVHRAVVAFRMRAHARKAAEATAASAVGHLSVTAQKLGVDSVCISTTAVGRGLEAQVSATVHLEVESTMVLVPRGSWMASAKKAKRARKSSGVSKEPKRPRIVSRNRNHSGGRVISLSSTTDDQVSLENTMGGPLARALLKIAQSTPKLSYGALRSALEFHFFEEHRERVAKIEQLELYTERFRELDDTYDIQPPEVKEFLDEQRNKLPCSSSELREPQWPQVWCSDPLDEEELFEP